MYPRHEKYLNYFNSNHAVIECCNSIYNYSDLRSNDMPTVNFSSRRADVKALQSGFRP